MTEHLVMIKWLNQTGSYKLGESRLRYFQETLNWNITTHGFLKILLSVSFNLLERIIKQYSCTVFIACVPHMVLLL